MLFGLFRRKKGPQGEDVAGVVGHRRRQDQRIPCELPLRAKCSSWDSFHQLFSGNISKRGLYVPTDRETLIGDTIAVELTTPDGGTLKLSGAVVHVFRTPEGQHRGLGIQLDELHGPEQERYLRLIVEAESASAVKPREETPPPAGRTPRPPASSSVAPADPAVPAAPQRTSYAMKGSGAARQPKPASGAPPVPPPTPGARPPATPLAGAPALPPLRTGAPASQAASTADQADDPSLGPDISGEIPIDFDDENAVPPPPRVQAPAPSLIRRSPAGQPLVAMDFGTSMSSVAVVQGQEVVVLQGRDGRRDIPSVIGFPEGGPICIGVEARKLLVVDPARAIASPKRLLGRDFDEREVEPFLAGLAMPHSKGRDGRVLLHPEGQTLTVPQVCVPILAALRARTEQYLGCEIHRAVLTVPVSFDDARNAALKEAAAMAGLTSVEIIDEPTAAAMAYCFDPSFRGTVAVYDFGGGTFDFSVLDVDSADLQVLSTAGDSWLGGDDFDSALAGAAADAFWRETKIELRHNVVQWQRLLMAAELTKRELSSRDEAVLELPEAALTAQGPLHLRFPVTRATFAQLCADVIGRSLTTCQDALDLSELQAAKLNAVYLSGGTCHIPAVRDAVAGFFGKQGRVSVPPERAVVVGAAMHAARAQGARITLA